MKSGELVADGGCMSQVHRFHDSAGLVAQRLLALRVGRV
ncbi:hypothetical protein GA0115254_11071, partial [Streptomyces sp. Ncost-T10-10d]